MPHTSGYRFRGRKRRRILPVQVSTQVTKGVSIPTMPTMPTMPDIEKVKAAATAVKAQGMAMKDTMMSEAEKRRKRFKVLGR